MKSAIELAMEKTEELVDNQQQAERGAARRHLRHQERIRGQVGGAGDRAQTAAGEKLAREADPQAFAENQRQLQEEMNQVRDRILQRAGREDRGGARAGLRLSCPQSTGNWPQGRDPHAIALEDRKKGLPNRGVFSKAALPLAAAALAALAGMRLQCRLPGGPGPCLHPAGSGRNHRFVVRSARQPRRRGPGVLQGVLLRRVQSPAR